MAFSKYNRGRPFLVINRIASPSEGEKTSTKDWGKTGKWKMDEEILIVDRVTNKHTLQATVIIDILQRKMVKNRFSNTTDNDTVIKHYLTTYNDHVVDGLQTWMKQNAKDEEVTKQVIENLQDELDQIEVEIKNDE